MLLCEIIIIILIAAHFVSDHRYITRFQNKIDLCERAQKPQIHSRSVELLGDTFTASVYVYLSWVEEHRGLLATDSAKTNEQLDFTYYCFYMTS